MPTNLDKLCKYTKVMSRADRRIKIAKATESLENLTSLYNSPEEMFDGINSGRQLLDDSTRPNLSADDMANMFNTKRPYAEFGLRDGGRAHLHMNDNGIHATMDHPEHGRQIIGFMTQMGDDNDLTVAQEYRGKGIGSKLAREYFSMYPERILNQNPANPKRFTQGGKKTVISALAQYFINSQGTGPQPVVKSAEVQEYSPDVQVLDIGQYLDLWNRYGKKERKDAKYHTNYITITKGDVSKLAKKHGLSLDDIDIEQMLMGIQVEMEHWNTVGEDIHKVMSVVMDHLAEFPDYYTGLNKMESKLKKGLVNPSIQYVDADLGNLRGDFREKIIDLINKVKNDNDLDITVLEGLRTNARQQYLQDRHTPDPRSHMDDVYRQGVSDPESEKEQETDIALGVDGFGPEIHYILHKVFKEMFGDAVADMEFGNEFIYSSGEPGLNQFMRRTEDHRRPTENDEFINPEAMFGGSNSVHKAKRYMGWGEDNKPELSAKDDINDQLSIDDASRHELAAEIHAAKLDRIRSQNEDLMLEHSANRQKLEESVGAARIGRNWPDEIPIGAQLLNLQPPKVKAPEKAAAEAAEVARQKRLVELGNLPNPLEAPMRVDPPKMDADSIEELLSMAKTRRNLEGWKAPALTQEELVPESIMREMTGKIEPTPSEQARSAEASRNAPMNRLKETISGTQQAIGAGIDRESGKVVSTAKNLGRRIDSNPLTKFIAGALGLNKNLDQLLPVSIQERGAKQLSNQTAPVNPAKNMPTTSEFSKSINALKSFRPQDEQRPNT